MPEREEWLDISNSEALWEAIKTLAIRGAPLIGFAGIIGVYFALRESSSDALFSDKIQSLLSVRPTAVNLTAEVNQVLSKLTNIPSREERLQIILNRIHQAKQTGIEECQQIAENGCSLLQNGEGILTHCNTGSLASLGIGTALGIIKLAYEKFDHIRVFHTETRPLFQGSRLTAYELQKCAIPSEMVIDSAATALMATGKISTVIVGADRIAHNGDTANKIGTLSLAISARYYHVPFYVAAPTSTIDPHTKTGKDIVIEIRDDKEVSECHEKKLAPLGTKIWNPAFDVTPKELIRAIITEKGINPLS